MDTASNQPVISVASKTLAIFDPSVDGLRNIILRLAFSDDAPASKAVLRSLLAVSAVQRNGPSPQAERLKLTALRALRNSSQSSVEGKVGIQQAAAQMLLCSVEVSPTPESERNKKPAFCLLITKGYRSRTRAPSGPGISVQPTTSSTPPSWAPCPPAASGRALWTGLPTSTSSVALVCRTGGEVARIGARPQTSASGCLQYVRIQTYVAREAIRIEPSRMI
jgi:hypothetical protein